MAQTETSQLKSAYFAGGCFWCMEAAFESITGVEEAISGYMPLDGLENKTEVVQVIYDPARVSYEKLLEIFWLSIDPFDAGGQFYDRGDGYRTAIITSNAAEQEAAQRSKDETERTLGKPVAPMITAATIFHVAEDHHQDFYKTNAAHYERYKYGSGRPDRLKRIWGENTK